MWVPTQKHLAYEISIVECVKLAFDWACTFYTQGVLFSSYNAYLYTHIIFTMYIHILLFYKLDAYAMFLHAGVRLGFRAPKDIVGALIMLFS